MGELMTAYCLSVGDGVGEADQKGKFVDEDTEIFTISHPPWITVCDEAREELEALAPPRQLVEDWNRNAWKMMPRETWEEVDYEKRYIRHIERSPPAEKAIRKIRLMLKTRDVCIVCGDKCYDICPRRLLYEKITEQIE